MADNKEDGAVGYKRAPVKHQFPKGQSGNPRGRPKGAGNFSSMMDDILGEEMRLKMNGRSVVVTGRHALALLMVDRAVRGDVRMIQLLQKYGGFQRSDEPLIMWMPEWAQDL
jgi:hypothetical protein